MAFEAERTGFGWGRGQGRLRRRALAAAVVLIAGLVAGATSAQALTLRRSSLIDRPADQVWALLGDFGGMARWHGAGTQGRVEGDLGRGLRRVQTSADGRVNDELLLEYSREKRLIRYSLLNVDAWPRPYTSYAVTLQVEPAGAAASRVVWLMEAEPKPGAAGAQTREVLDLIHRSIMEQAAQALGTTARFE